MIAGKSTPDQAPARIAAYRDPEFMAALIDMLVETSIDYLTAQVDAGADAIPALREFRCRALGAASGAALVHAHAPNRRGAEGPASASQGHRLPARGAGPISPNSWKRALPMPSLSTGRWIPHPGVADAAADAPDSGAISIR